ncbi:MAG: hypothetical protein N4A68_16900 [Maledivibacter sp.]|jgi:nitrogen regulatory protein PII|nr:hypothetical protein [Maledivibacter sp.]
MYALFLILNDVDKVEDIHKIFYDIGCGATTLDSVGMGRVLLQNKVDVPIFAGIRKLLDGNKPYNKTIVSVIKDEDKLRKAIDAIKEELKLGTENTMGIGFMFVVPVLECYGGIK